MGGGPRLPGRSPEEDAADKRGHRESITINIAGPGMFTQNPDGSFVWSGHGTWSWWTHPDTGEPGWFLTKGRFVLSVDAEGNSTWKRAGTIEDLCARLR